MLSDTWTGILGSIADPCDFLPAWSDEFKKVCYQYSNNFIGQYLDYSPASLYIYHFSNHEISHLSLWTHLNIEIFLNLTCSVE
jgi:hypothetical protein